MAGLGCTACVIGLMNKIIIRRSIISIIGITLNLHDAAVKTILLKNIIKYHNREMYVQNSHN